MKSLVINLPDRLDRWEVAEPHLREKGFRPQRYAGQLMMPGHAGCTASHLGALASAGRAPFVIFEDDAEFVGDPTIMGLAMEELGQFDMLYLGCRPVERVVRSTEHTVRIRNVYQTHAIVYGSDRVVDYILSQRNEARKIDVFFSEFILPKYKCYATNPMICKQRDSISDITYKFVSHSEIINHFNSMIDG